jgi:hypothetical protein
VLGHLTTAGRPGQVMPAVVRVGVSWVGASNSRYPAVAAEVWRGPWWPGAWLPNYVCVLCAACMCGDTSAATRVGVSARVVVGPLGALPLDSRRGIQ